MGVDYRGVGGIGIEFTYEHLEMVVNKGVLDDIDTPDKIDTDYFGEYLAELDLEYECGGDGYGGETNYYILVPGKNLTEINQNSKAFIERLGSLGINITEDDLIVISDLYIY